MKVYFTFTAHLKQQQKHLKMFRAVLNVNVNVNLNVISVFSFDLGMSKIIIWIISLCELKHKKARKTADPTNILKT